MAKLCYLPYMKRELLIPLLIAAATLVSCSTTRKVNKQTVAVDSTWQNERRALLESNEALSHKIEELTNDSSSQVVIFEQNEPPKGSTTQTQHFDVVLEWDGHIYTFDSLQWAIITSYFKWANKPPNKVKFKDGKISEAEGNIKSAQSKDNSYTRTIDSLSEANYLLRDSLESSKGQVRTETVIKTVEVKRRSWWWLWILIGAVGGFALRHNLAWGKRKLFG